MPTWTVTQYPQQITTLEATPSVKNWVSKILNRSPNGDWNVIKRWATGSDWRNIKFRATGSHERSVNTGEREVDPQTNTDGAQKNQEIR